MCCLHRSTSWSADAGTSKATASTTEKGLHPCPPDMHKNSSMKFKSLHNAAHSMHDASVPVMLTCCAFCCTLLSLLPLAPLLGMTPVPFLAPLLRLVLPWGDAEALLSLPMSGSSFCSVARSWTTSPTTHNGGFWHFCFTELIVMFLLFVSWKTLFTESGHWSNIYPRKFQARSASCHVCHCHAIPGSASKRPFFQPLFCS